MLDEATAMLDPVGRREVLATVHRLNREKGMTVVLITHHMNEAEEADRVVVMDDGAVVMDGTPQEVFTQVEPLRSLGLTVPDTVGPAGPAASSRRGGSAGRSARRGMCRRHRGGFAINRREGTRDVGTNPANQTSDPHLRRGYPLPAQRWWRI